MAKRRAEDILLHDSPSKRCYRSICSADVQLGSMAPAGGVRPPSLLALLGNRSRKRPHYFEDPEEQQEAAPYRKPSAKHAATTVQQTSASFQDRRSSSGALTVSKKRPRENSVGSETAAPKEDDKAEEDPNTEDCTYNSFQYWRPPLPELDLSLLEDASDVSPTEKKTKVKNSSSDAMET